MPNPEIDLAAHIASALTLVVGTDVFSGMVRPKGDGVPARAVFCMPTGGPKPSNFCGVSKVRRFSPVQVRVRYDQDDEDAGILFARLVRDAVHHATIGGYIEIETQQSEPSPLGPDRQGLPEWSIPVEMISEG